MYLPADLVSIRSKGAVLLILALWALVFKASSQAWRYGDYYDYGWYVPPLALLIFLRRWRELPEQATQAGLLPWIVTALLLPLWAVARVLSVADPFWRLPQWAAAVLALVASHLLIVRCKGRGSSLAFLPVAAFALTAVPLPKGIENPTVEFLSNGVIQLAAEIFNILGRPIQIWGNRMESMGEWVEVADGCSGIRSLQGFLMVGLFFGEWFRLGLLERGLLLWLSLGCVWLANVVRAMVLAWLRFESGVPTLERWHDPLSLLTFGVAAAATWWIANRLEPTRAKPPATVPQAVPQAIPKPPAISKRVAWSGLVMLVGIELAAWVWMHPRRHHPLPVLELRYPPPGTKPRFDVAGYEKARPSLRCTDGWMASVGEDRGDRKMRAGWFAWDSADSGSVLEVFQHKPEACMGAVGWTLMARGKPRTFRWEGGSLDFDVTEFKAPGLDQMLYVYKAVWISTLPESRVRGGIGDLGTTDSLRRLRLAMAWHRFRPDHARVLMGVVAGEDREIDAWEHFQSSLLPGLYLRPANALPPP